MIYYYDIYGWQSKTPIEGRSTTLEPPQPVGNKIPNFTGYSWVLLEYTPPPPAPTGEENATQADLILSETDWTSIPAVGDPNQSNPYLINQNEWLDYRSKIRNISVNKIAGSIEWPTAPNEQWSS